MNFCSITCISPHRKRPTYAPYDSKDCELTVQPCDVVCRTGGEAPDRVDSAGLKAGTIGAKTSNTLCLKTALLSRSTIFTNQGFTSEN